MASTNGKCQFAADRLLFTFDLDTYTLHAFRLNLPLPLMKISKPPYTKEPWGEPLILPGLGVWLVEKVPLRYGLTTRLSSGDISQANTLGNSPYSGVRYMK